jgi:hypothetical protein
LGLLLFTGALLFGVEARGQSPRTVEKTVQMDPDGEVVLSVTSGRVQVSTWERSAVGVTARLTSADEAQGKIGPVQVKGGPDAVTIKRAGEEVESGGLWSLLGLGDPEGPETHYILRVPSTARLSISTKRAPVDVRGLAGDLTVEATSSPIRLHNTTGDVTVATFSGSLEADSLRGNLLFATFSGDATVRRRALDGDNQLASFSGSAEITLPADAAFDLSTDITWGGAVTSDFVPPDSLGQGEGPVLVSGGGPTVSFESFSGSLTLRAE